ncbi:MAG: NifB/NifX family molybdenum-iron cluster-binding protein [Sedimentisphaerales bacterium]|nr:NifB/NifX family molybdenum-iron cluster-binding protein [Sedimentisphaerales bacterium]
MKIAIPVYGNTVSNVFDFAHRIMLVDVENGREINRCEVDVGNRSLPQRAGQLKTMGVNVLICGAISQLLSAMVTASGIEVLPYVTGNIENVLDAYLAGQLIRQEFSMPGFRPGLRRGLGRRQGCRWRGGLR